MDNVRYAVIGGSGLYNMPELTDVQEVHIATPFGPTSDSIKIGTLHGQRIAFLPRHGRGHVLSPSEVPYRANMYALKTLGVKQIVAVSACGSLQESLPPGCIVVPDQLYDNTRLDRGRTFFGGGMVVHIGVADPFCPHLSKAIANGTRAAGAEVYEGGTFITIEGPRFSTRGESEVFRKMGLSIIGMTTSPEAFLAREAEMCYAVMAHVTDYDVWHQTAQAVTVEMVFKQFQANVAMAQRAIMNVVNEMAADDRPCTCQDALATAIATNREKITPEIITKLKPIIGRYFEA